MDSIPRAAAVSDALCIVEVWRRYYKSSTALPPPFVLPWLLAPAAAHRAPSTAHPRLTMTDSQGFYGWSVLFRRSGRALLVSWRGAFVDRCVYHHYGIVAAATAAIHVTRPCRHRASNSPSPSRTIRRSPLERCRLAQHHGRRRVPPLLRQLQRGLTPMLLAQRRTRRDEQLEQAHVTRGGRAVQQRAPLGGAQVHGSAALQEHLVRAATIG